MGLNSNELLEYLIGYVEYNLIDTDDEDVMIFNQGQFEGMLFTLEILGCEKIARTLDKRYGSIIRRESD